MTTTAYRWTRFSERAPRATVGRRARVVGFTRGIRTFTQSPYVFTSLPNARAFVGHPTTTSGYVLLGLSYFGSKLVLETVLGKHWG